MSNISNGAKTIIDNPTKFYRDKHNHIPPWILFKNINFSSIIDLYSFFKSKDKHDIIQDYFPHNSGGDDAAKLLKDMLSIVRDFRNKIAHNLKFISHKSRFTLNIRMLRNVSSNVTITKLNFSKNVGENDILAFILSLVTLLDNEHLVKMMITEILFLFDREASMADKYIKATNIPEAIRELLKNIINDSSS